MFGAKKTEKEVVTVETLYRDAREELDTGNYNNAIKQFEELAARYPYGRYAQQAQLEIAYANYKNRDPVVALAAIDRFLKQYPTHLAADYAYYLKGLIHFIDDRTLFAAIAQQDMSERDPKAARESFNAFRELVSRYPKSRYADDARDRMAYLVTALADNELHVARYYMKRGAYLAAANRAKTVLESYPASDRSEPALVILIAAYDQLGQVELRDDARRVFQKNYPGSTLSAEMLQTERPWWKLW